MQEKTKLAIILGSAREQRFCGKVANWARREIDALGSFEVDVIDPVEIGLPRRIEQDEGPATSSLNARIAYADAFVIITPEYNHGYTAALKEVIDSAYAEWNAKPVAFISYGGQAGGLRAVEQLRQVFAELQTVTVRDTVSFANAWSRFGDDENPNGLTSEKKALDLMMARLVWWSEALKTARRATPYNQAAA